MRQLLKYFLPIIFILSIIHSEAQDHSWALVMSKNTGYTSSIWRTRTYFPKDEIKEHWDKGYYISDITYNKGKWALIMVKGSGFEDQMWRTRTAFPEDEIKEYWDKKYYITNLSFADGKWVLVMSKGVGYYASIWRTKTYFPEKEIKEYRDKDFYITELSQGLFSKPVEEVIFVPNDPPVITITEPSLTRGFKVVKETQIKIAGYAKDKDGISEVSVNNIRANVDMNRYFFAYISLQQGDNQVTVKAIDNKFTSSTKSFSLNKAKEEIAPVYNEKRVALVIGNSN